MTRRKPYRRPRRIKQKKSLAGKILKSKLFWSGFFGLVFLSSAVYGLIFSPLLKIERIEIAGAGKIGERRAQEQGWQAVTRDWKIMRLQRMLLVSEKSVEKSFMEKFPEVRQVQLDRKFPDTIKLTVWERRAAAVWCRDEEAAECFSVDKEGVVFQRRQQGEFLPIFRYLDDQSFSLGQVIIAPRILEGILDFDERFGQYVLGQQIKAEISFSRIISDDRINIQINEGWEVYFNPQEDANWQITKLETVLSQTISHAERQDLQYIDLRFGDQAFVKYKNS